MGASVINFLGSLSSTVFRFAAICFVIVNGLALAAFTLTRNRRLVDVWTPRLVTIDTVLLGAGLGIPLLSGLARIGVRVIGGMTAGLLAAFK